MPDLGTYESNLKNIESQLGQYGSNLPSEIESQIQGAYTPLLKESLDVTRDQMSDYLGRYFDVTSMGTGMQGTSAIDLSPTQKLGVMGRELGTMSGNLQASQRYSDYLGGQMNDMYQKALGAAQMGQQNLADQYARAFQLYQMKWQEAEAAKDRAASLAAARAGAPVYTTTGGEQVIDTGDDNEQAKPANWTQKALNTMDKNSFLGGTDATTLRPTTTKQAITQGLTAAINPLSAIKTAAGALGNLYGNWNNEDWSFARKLTNIR